MKLIPMKVNLPVMLMLDGDADIRDIARGLHSIGLTLQISVKPKVARKKKRAKK